MVKETYSQMRERHQKEVDALPIEFAFSNKQFEEACKKLGVKNPKTELYKLPLSGGFYRRKDADLVYGTFDRHDKELSEAMADSEFAVGAFKHEAWDHEIIYSYTPNADMADAFGYPTKKNKDGYTEIDWGKVKNGTLLKECYEKGMAEYYKKARECA